MTIDSADDSKISNRTINTNRISNRTYDSKSNRITKLRRSLANTLHALLKTTNIAELWAALLQYGMICHRSSLMRQSCHFERHFDLVLLQLADTFNTQFKYREGSRHSLLKRLKCWRKSCAKFDLLLLNMQDANACSLEKANSTAGPILRIS